MPFRKHAQAFSRHVWQHLRSLDLRFPLRDDEASFRKHFTQNLARNGGVVMLMGVIAITTSTMPMLGVEKRRRDDPFEWDSSDPRSLFFCIRFLSIVLGSTSVLFCFLHWRFGMFRWLNWEFMVVAIACWWMSPGSLGNWHISKLCGSDPQDDWGVRTEGYYFIHVFVMDAVITCSCLLLPIRCCILWLMNVWGVLSFNIVSVVTGSPFPEAHRSIIITYLIMAGCSWWGAMRNEEHARMEWRANLMVYESEQVVESQKRRILDRDAVVSSMASVIQAMCDIVIDLTPDLHVCNLSNVHTSFFGIDLLSRPFTDVVSFTDLQRFRDLLQRVDADAMPQCLPVTLILDSKPVEAHLLTVGTGVPEPCYIIGVRCEQTVDNAGIADGVLDTSLYSTSLDMPEIQKDSALPLDMLDATLPNEAADLDTHSFAMLDSIVPAFEKKSSQSEVESMASAITFKTTPSGQNTTLNPSPYCSPWVSLPAVGLGMGNYTQVRCAGRGNQATVYEVKDEAGNTFALKRISLLGKVWQRDFGANLKSADREVRILKSLSWASEVVVHLQECWIQSDMKFACIVMEWLPKTLSGVLDARTRATEERGFTPLSDICCWLACMALGIAAVHSVDWMHRDIKTSNMLLTEDERRCKVGDLGIGRPMRMTSTLDDNGETETTCSTCDSVLTGYTENRGTMMYMSPEALAPGGYYGKPSDIYGLGCVLFELLVGPMVFGEAVARGLSEQVAADTLLANEQLRCFDEDRKAYPQLKKLCLQMLSPKSVERPSAKMIVGNECLKVYIEDLTHMSPSLSQALSEP